MHVIFCCQRPASFAGSTSCFCREPPGQAGLVFKHSSRYTSAADAHQQAAMPACCALWAAATYWLSPATTRVDLQAVLEGAVLCCGTGCPAAPGAVLPLWTGRSLGPGVSLKSCSNSVSIRQRLARIHLHNTYHNCTIAPGLHCGAVKARHPCLPDDKLRPWWSTPHLITICFGRRQDVNCTMLTSGLCVLGSCSKPAAC